MFGAIAKTYYAQKIGKKPEDMFVVSIMPCTAKKYEAQRPEMTDSGARDVDVVLTTRELGRMIKTLYLLRFIDDESYRRRILIQLNRGENRHRLAHVIFHGKRGELRQRYRDGQEDQLGSLGLVVNRDGERFYDEGEDFWPKRYAIWGRLVAQQPGQDFALECLVRQPVAVNDAAE